MGVSPGAPGRRHRRGPAERRVPRSGPGDHESEARPGPGTPDQGDERAGDRPGAGRLDQDRLPLPRGRRPRATNQRTRQDPPRLKPGRVPGPTGGWPGTPCGVPKPEDPGPAPYSRAAPWRPEPTARGAGTGGRGGSTAGPRGASPRVDPGDAAAGRSVDVAAGARLLPLAPLDCRVHPASLSSRGSLGLRAEGPSPAGGGEPFGLDVLARGDRAVGVARDVLDTEIDPDEVRRWGLEFRWARAVGLRARPARGARGKVNPCPRI
jgi:hypothetical protein